MRERMELHRTSPICASCHVQMDPLGFSLENYDGIGAWRDDEGGTLIDASGTLPHTAPFEGPSGLRGVLLGQEERFVETVYRKAPDLCTRSRRRVLRCTGGSEHYQGCREK